MASVEEKLSDLKLEGSKDAPSGEGSPEKAKESVVEELKEGLPELQHVTTKDTTNPSEGDSATPEGAVKAEVPKAFEEELKKDHDIAPDAAAKSEEKPTNVVKATEKEQVGPEAGDKASPTSETPVEVKHEVVDTKPPSAISSIGGKIQKMFSKDKDSS